MSAREPVSYVVHLLSRQPSTARTASQMKLLVGCMADVPGQDSNATDTQTCHKHQQPRFKAGPLNLHVLSRIRR